MNNFLPQVSKSMSAAQSSLTESVCEDDLELSGGSVSSQEGSTEYLAARPSVARRKANLQELENVYFTVSLYKLL